MSLLALENLQVSYGGIRAVKSVDLTVEPGELVCLIGANGAGKTTTLKAASGLLAAERGALTGGRISFKGRSLVGRPARALVRDGLVQVLEGRHCFPHLTVEANLITGTLHARSTRASLRRDLDRIYQYFPRLKTVRRTLAGFTSGGEQQMVAIGRALMAHPSLVLLDEPSMGLAPQIVEEIFRIIRTLNREQGVSFLLAEQNARVALRHADHAYVLENGRVAAAGTADELGRRPDVRELYLGVGAGKAARAERSELEARGPG